MTVLRVDGPLEIIKHVIAFSDAVVDHSSYKIGNAIWFGMEPRFGSPLLGWLDWKITGQPTTRLAKPGWLLFDRSLNFIEISEMHENLGNYKTFL